MKHFASAASCRAGDEIHDGKANGKFYLFSDGQVVVADPNAVKTLATITTDHIGARFVDSTGNALVWGDSVYMESPQTKKFHVFVNAYSPQLQNESFMYIFDTVADKVGGPLL
jgi:hypothetical protein